MIARFEYPRLTLDPRLMLYTCSVTSRPIPTGSMPSAARPTTARRWRSAAPRGMRPLAAHCHLGLGTVSRRIGKREQAQEHLITAATMFREMGRRLWLDQAETEMREPGG